MTALKICGLVREQDVVACAELGVDAIGINLWPGSKRHVDPDRARALLEARPDPRMLAIAVMVDPEPDQARRAIELGFDAIQFHGEAAPERCAGFGLPWIQVIRGTPGLDDARTPTPAPRWLLLDSQVAGMGGAGVRTDWTWARAAVERFATLPVWLAGGIDPGNARDAIAAVGPAGLDVASGAEGGLGPRAKDREAIAALRDACGR